MLGTIVNAAAIVAGSLIGLLLKRGIPEKYTDVVMKGLALCTLYIGIEGALKGVNVVVVIVSILAGGLLGTLLDLDGRLCALGARLQKGIAKKTGKTNGSFSEGFVTATLLYCTGAMAIVGALNGGISGDHSTLYTKSVLDFIPSIVLTASMGAGVMFSALSVLLYQGSIALLASALAPVLSEAVIAQMTCTGSILIMGMGFNLLGVTKLKIMDYIPAVLFAAVITALL